MSKENVEVGDVWKHKRLESLLYIIEVGTNFITFLGCVNDIFPHRTYKRYYVNSFSILDDDPRYNRFTEDYEYKGKSKVNVEDLFKTENICGTKKNQ